MFLQLTSQRGDVVFAARCHGQFGNAFAEQSDQAILHQGGRGPNNHNSLTWKSSSCHRDSSLNFLLRVLIQQGRAVIPGLNLARVFDATANLDRMDIGLMTHNNWQQRHDWSSSSA